MKVVDRNMQKTFLRMAREIAAGMTYLSGMQFVHRVGKSLLTRLPSTNPQGMLYLSGMQYVHRL